MRIDADLLRKPAIWHTVFIINALTSVLTATISTTHYCKQHICTVYMSLLLHSYSDVTNDITAHNLNYNALFRILAIKEVIVSLKNTR